MMNLWMREHIWCRKAISALILIVFCACFVFANAKAAVDVGGVPYGAPLAVPSIYSHLDVDTFTVPGHLGEIKDVYKGTSDKFIVHLRDAHGNSYAQHKIAGIIDYVSKEYGIRMVNLEGGVGEYDLSVFTAISGEAIRSEVADYFIDKGEINGAELYAINNPEKVKLWGIEDKELYLENLKIYRDSLTYKEDVDKFLKELTHILNDLKRNIYIPKLLKIDMAYGAYKAGNMKFREYLEFLIEEAKYSGIQVRQFSNLYLLAQAMEIEDKVDFNKANRERNELVKELKQVLSKNEIRELVSKSLAFKTKRISRKIFYSYLIGKAEELDINVERFPALTNYIMYVTTYEAVNRSKIMGEMDGLEAAIKEPVYQNNVQRRLNLLSRNLALLKNIFDISLTKTDYKYYLANKSPFDVYNYLEFIKEQAPIYKIEKRPDSKITALDGYREDISRFYEYSFKRDEMFLKNIRFESMGRRGAIVMTGGFHTENLRELFEKEGISYISILPKFTTAKDFKNYYFDLLAGQTTNLQRMLRSVIAKASTLQIASKLNRILGTAVYGETGMTAFEAAVRVRAKMVEKAEENKNIKFVLVHEGKKIYSVGKGKERKIQLKNLLDEIKKDEKQKDKKPPIKPPKGGEGVVLQPLTKEFAEANIARLVELYNSIEGANWTEERFLADVWMEGQFDQKKDRAFPGKWEHSFVTVDRNGYPIGFVLAYERKAGDLASVDENSVYIHGLAVDSNYQRQKIATRLMYGLSNNLMNNGFLKLKDTKTGFISLQTDETNEDAQSFYESIGFIKRETVQKGKHMDYIYSVESNVVAEETTKIFKSAGFIVEKETKPEEIVIDNVTSASKNVLADIRPGAHPSVVLVEISEDQKIFDGSGYVQIKHKTGSMFTKKYDVNTRVVYYTPASDINDVVKEITKAGFMKNEESRVIAFTSKKNDNYKTMVDVLDTEIGQDRVTGVVNGNFADPADPQTKRFSVVNLTVFGLGLMECDREKKGTDRYNGIALSVKNLFIQLAEPVEGIKDMDVTKFIEDLINGILIMKIKKIDYGKMSEYMEAEAEALESL